MKKLPIILCISLVLGVCTSARAVGWDNGGRGKLFKFATGAPFIGFYDGE